MWFRVVLAVALASAAPLPSAGSDVPRPAIEVPRIFEAPDIDGVLGEGIWQGRPLQTSTWKSYDPVRGQDMSERTDVWVTHDDRYLYFAFRAFDREPGGIRTTISRRDNVWGDDWVGLSLDSFGTGQSSYHLMVNPSGIQMDALNSVARAEDWSSDFVWDSAGRITDEGYEAEIRLPLASIRFDGGDEVRMGILFWRRISRAGVSWAWPELLPGQWVFDSHATLVFRELEQPRLIEVIPSATFTRNQDRERPDLWGEVRNDPDAGISLKYGLTSSIVLEGTLNPDFSQVESDAFQNQVNQRFPIFFDEKRPFFMEGNSMFSLAGTGGDAEMRTAVHTRKIIDPSAGLKIAGTAGNTNFGYLSAADEAPGRATEDGPANPYEGRKRYFNIGRAQHSFGQASYVGAIFTDTRFADGHNQVIGADAVWRLDPRQRVTATFLDSDTRAPDGARDRRGQALQGTYSFDTLPFDSFTQVEHYDEGFHMETAFLNRTGVTTVKSFSRANFYPESGGWLKRLGPTLWMSLGEDRVHDGREKVFQPGFSANFTRQGYAGVNFRIGREPWLGTLYERNWVNAWGGAQFTRWLRVTGWLRSGTEIFYDFENPFQGEATISEIDVTFQPNSRFNQNVGYENVRFDRASDGDRVFTVDILNTNTRYQFNKHFFVRALAQYDSSRRRVLTDLLASYQWVPGTVVHLGYGSLIERRDFRDGRWIAGDGDYLTTSRGLFFKVSYLYRF